MSLAMAVRRGSLTVEQIDHELCRISGALAAARSQRDGERAERLHMDADRWLDIRNELMATRARIAAEGVRGL